MRGQLDKPVGFLRPNDPPSSVGPTSRCLVVAVVPTCSNGRKLLLLATDSGDGLRPLQEDGLMPKPLLIRRLQLVNMSDNVKTI